MRENLYFLLQEESLSSNVFFVQREATAGRSSGRTVFGILQS